MFIFYLFSAVLIFLSYKSLRGGINYLNFFKKELSKPKSGFTPFVSIIAPCRGVDEDLEKNLSALFEQDFPAYEIVFAVDSESDAAVEIIEKVSRRKGAKIAKLIVAGKAENEAQKVHNLREAVTQVSDESKVFVFVDSDARPAKDWLKDLIAPLENKNIGCATGYRWFMAKEFSLAAELRSAWNASIASALGADETRNFCWGGSLAMRRETFENLKMREKWQGVLSDDFAVTRAMKEHQLPVYFVPQALTASIENCSMGELLEFTTRQMKITRVYASNLWIQSFIGSGLFNLVFIWGILIIVLSSINTFSFWFALTALMSISAFSVGKAWFRLKAVKLVLKDYEKELNKQFWTQNSLWIFTPALFFYNSLCALFSRKITWRGITYQLISPNSTEILPDNSRAK